MEKLKKNTATSKVKKNYSLNIMHNIYVLKLFKKIYPGHFGRNEIMQLISGNTISVFPDPGFFQGKYNPTKSYHKKLTLTTLVLTPILIVFLWAMILPNLVYKCKGKTHKGSNVGDNASIFFSNNLDTAFFDLLDSACITNNGRNIRSKNVNPRGLLCSDISRNH